MAYIFLLIFTFVEFNCENLFDTRHDSLKNDYEFLPESARRWTPARYREKLGNISRTIASCGNVSDMSLPDMAVLTEVENDSVMGDLTRQAPLRAIGYHYVMTDSPDKRGIDVALLYSPRSFHLLNSRSIRIDPPDGRRPTRDILYASGITINGDTLHVFAVHAPSRSGGERLTRPYRVLVAERLLAAVDSVNAVCSSPLIIIAGDFNDYSGDAALKMLTDYGLKEVSLKAKGSNGAEGTYRFQGVWGSLDHIFCNQSMAAMLGGCHINDAPFLLEEDKKYGGAKPRRTYIGIRYEGGYSDHLPLVALFNF